MMETWNNSRGSRLHNGDVEEFLRNKFPLWKTCAVIQKVERVEK